MSAVKEWPLSWMPSVLHPVNAYIECMLYNPLSHDVPEYTDMFSAIENVYCVGHFLLR